MSDCNLDFPSRAAHQEEAGHPKSDGDLPPNGWLQDSGLPTGTSAVVRDTGRRAPQVRKIRSVHYAFTDAVPKTTSRPPCQFSTAESSIFLVAYLFQMSILSSGDFRVGVFLVLTTVLISAAPRAATTTAAHRSVAGRPRPDARPMPPLSVDYSLCRPARAYGSQQVPNPSNVLGVFGLSIRTQERDLDEEFSWFGRVEKVTIVCNQRVSGVALGEMRILKLGAV